MPPPPEEYEYITYTESSGVEAFHKSLVERNEFCKCCFQVSRNLCVFSQQVPADLKDHQKIDIKWLVDLLQLADSAESGCQFCGFVAVRCFFTFAFYTFGPLELKNPLSCCIEGISTENQDVGEDEKGSPVSQAVVKLRQFCAENVGAKLGFRISPTDYVKETRSYRRLKLSPITKWNFDQEGVNKLLGLKGSTTIEVYSSDDDPAGKFIKGRPINTNPNSAESLSRAKSWIEDCLHNHPGCPGLHDTMLPSRVLKITHSNNITLYTPKQGETGPYIALSYCWGGPQNFSTTTSTIEQYSKGFDVSELPQTLQDAVIVARNLGVQYLWVDALCIIQDSLDDKANELPKLSMYYKNSHATICGGGTSVDQGFLKPKHECQTHPGTGLPQNLLKMPFMCSGEDEGSPDEGKVGYIYFCEETPHFLSREPVSQRAWTLQEQLLSPRFLLYGQRLIWQCHSAQLADGGVEDWSLDTNASGNRRIQFLLYNPKTAPTLDEAEKVDAANLASSDEAQITTKLQNQTLSEGRIKKGEHAPKPPPIYELWYHTIRGFSRRKISFPEDRLPAIAGLASEIAQSTKDTYLAGLWRSQLLRELMWSTYPTLHTFKPDVWRAPTWTWASVDNDINFGRLPGSGFRAVAEVISCETTLLYPGNDFGEVTGGILTIKAPAVDLDRESILGMMKQDFAWIGPSGESFLSAIHDTNLLPQDGSKQVSSDKWEPPADLKLLILWAEVLEEEAEEGEVSDDQRKRIEDEKREESVEGNDSEPEDKSGGGGGGGEENRDQQEMKSVNKLAGLLVTKREDGRYERVSSFTNFVLNFSGGDFSLWLDEALEVCEMV